MFKVVSKIISKYGSAIFKGLLSSSQSASRMRNVHVVALSSVSSNVFEQK